MNDHLLRRGVWAVVSVTIALALLAVVAVRSVVSSMGEVAFRDAAHLVLVETLRASSEREARNARSFLLTGSPRFLSETHAANQTVRDQLATMRTSMSGEAERALLDEVERAEAAQWVAMERVIRLKGDGQTNEQVLHSFEVAVQPTRDALDDSILRLIELQEQELSTATHAARASVARTVKLLIGLSALGLALSLGLAIMLTRALRAQRHQREQLARHAVQIEAANRDLDAFAGRVSHDLRNVIAPLGFSAAMLRRPGASQEALESIAERIQRGVERSVGMLDGLLAFSRSGQPDPTARASVSESARDVLEELAPVIARVNAVVETELDEPIEVACSRELLDCVFHNLLGNALKFLEGREIRRVRISAASHGAACELVVEDTGPGIPEAVRTKIFEPFYRVPGTQAAGTGIGLATVRRIVDAHRGHIEVSSRAGGGTAFRVRLPLAAAEAPLAVDAPRAVEARQLDAPGRAVSVSATNELRAPANRGQRASS
jgi:signal transduction histidine kinase